RAEPMFFDTLDGELEIAARSANCFAFNRATLARESDPLALIHSSSFFWRATTKALRLALSVLSRVSRSSAFASFFLEKGQKNSAPGTEFSMSERKYRSISRSRPEAVV